jgi:hypothetical protein
MTRETLTITVLGDKVTLELSAAARAHLEDRVSLLEDPRACLSHLVQALAVAAAMPDHPREAASKARMTFSRWLAVVALAATGYSELGAHIERARASLVRA